MVVQEKGKYLLGSCTKCKGDIVLDTDDEPYCFQCGKRFYGVIEYKKIRESQDRSMNTFTQDKEFFIKNADIISLLEEGNTSDFIADRLVIPIRRVSEVRAVLKTKKEG